MHILICLGKCVEGERSECFGNEQTAISLNKVKAR